MHLAALEVARTEVVARVEVSTGARVAAMVVGTWVKGRLAVVVKVVEVVEAVRVAEKVGAKVGAKAAAMVGAAQEHHQVDMGAGKEVEVMVEATEGAREVEAMEEEKVGVLMAGATVEVTVEEAMAEAVVEEMVEAAKEAVMVAAATVVAQAVEREVMAAVVTEGAGTGELVVAAPLVGEERNLQEAQEATVVQAAPTEALQAATACLATHSLRSRCRRCTLRSLSPPSHHRRRRRQHKSTHYRTSEEPAGAAARAVAMVVTMAAAMAAAAMVAAAAATVVDGVEEGNSLRVARAEGKGAGRAE